MKILVLNAGSSSQKSAFYDIQDTPTEHALEPLWSGTAEWGNEEGKAEIKITAHGKTTTRTVTMDSRVEVIKQLLKTLWNGETRVLDLDHEYTDDEGMRAALAEIDVVGHRVVHGGPDYEHSVLITPEIERALEHIANFAPLHNPANIEGIAAITKFKPDMPQVAVFDTAFHRHMPAEAATYAGPYAWIQQGIHRYGFHGPSHRYCAHRSAQIVDRDIATLRIVTCHIGNGSSLAAIQGGQSIDTTMGFTPLDGLMMGSRSGEVDPSILFYLQRQHGYSIDELEHILNKESGLKGISGISSDMRKISQAIKEGNERARLARSMYIYRIRYYIGAMVAALGGIDILTFTGGIGEHDAELRASVCKNLAYLNLQLDQTRNEHAPVDQDIATANSQVRVLVVHTEEDWEIARECWQVLQQQRSRNNLAAHNSK
jgi:acetate kinase